MRGIQTGKLKRPAVVDPGPAPMLQWLPIQQLVVDDSYQRDLKPGNWKAIARIAENFKWSRFSPVFVAPIEGGLFAVIDGQHRAHAAAICGFAEVPCQVVQMSVQEQAASFAAVNGIVTKVTLFQIYKAALTAGEPWAVECAAICEKANCRLMTYHGSTDAKQAGEIYAISLIRFYQAKGVGRLVTFVIDALRRSDSGGDAAVWSNDILKAVIGAVVDRPWLHKNGIDLAPFWDRFDIYAAIDRAEEFARAKRRQGHVGVSRWDIATAEVGEALDKAYPQRMALPGAA